MKNIYSALLPFTVKGLQKIGVFLAYSASTAAGTLGLSLFLMYLTGNWGEGGNWSYGWIILIILISSLLLLFFCTCAGLAILFPKTRRSHFTKTCTKLCYLLCVILLGTFMAYAALFEIGYQYHAWD